MTRLATIAAIGAATLFSLPAFAQELPARIKDAGKIVIATMPNYPPITFKDPATNELQGFDIDLGEAIAKELGVKVEWQEIAFAQMLPSLQTGRVDLAMAGMSDKKARQETADFVDYMMSGAQFYTSKALSEEIKTVDDLCGKSVGASRSTDWPAQITAWSETNCVAKGKAAINVIGTEGSADARTQIKSGRLQAAAQGNETLPYNQKLEPDTYVAIGTAFSQSLAGIPVLKTETELRDAVKSALDKLQANDTYDQLLDKYGLKANKLSPITINKGE
ncbi:ABC transporter substrate-binding protein [Phyllobacterium sp. 0TCS1.6C]|uniref:ABC transporter substrate-binding protein n=1 Tax=unclassified Phyllobacterium TaxID=2638441 RepID=UPI002264A06F|nr:MULTISPECIES: ABC transporter substrate-binding protein [unclassified Phyllobacterium]MCX8278702.1 ABC transporter substrate-binding protein [Phyllobacterium sp. 0TCS1.6C]MCX8293468.1 ABC transporter substrate-binding protein [Phyllobacterium sp. 0TCS1.6A]